MNQEKLRQEVKKLKWQKGITFLDVAYYTGINEHTLYNFLSGHKANLGYKKAQILNDYLRGIEW